MPLDRFIGRTTVSIASLSACLSAFATAAEPTDGGTPNVAVGAQYDSSHVYVAKEDFDRFTASFTATFGGMLSKKSIADVTPTASETASQIALTPAGTISVFGFQTPIPYPFGIERYGYLVTDLDTAVSAASADGASIVVAPFADPIGRDAIIEWPGGVYMQLYWHTIAPHYAAVANEPEDRVYISGDTADTFVRDFVAFSRGSISSDDRAAPGLAIGMPGSTYRQIRIASAFGTMVVIVTDGHLPYPYGRETTGYGVADLAATLEKATTAGATVLVPPYRSEARTAAMVEFPGGYIAEIHTGIS
jgi:predicted enzyme related to lactoylglutathione lyase